MASLMEELIDILEQEYEVYRQLIPIADEKTRVIVKNDLTSLQAITAKEQLAVDQISALEHKRNELMLNIRTVINRKDGEFTLKTLIGLMEKQPKEQRALSLIHDNLKSTIQRLVEINNRNKSLIEQSLEMIEFNMNFIQSTRMSPGNNTYTKGASQYDSQSQVTGMFDAMQ
ncbi:flagellar protein FlgN [Lachnospiraceae bacterium MD1]|uniref:Flagellar protein FlgN n=1 Tax=Variimorphobacter saccharofermentans TaxID=2755051 RepID=A0A839K2R7_9FIRM|nr:flagellar protein FlgN [Variimorphobacter saccharofermentans]MBB2184205.1 flagellar protein FlgN [Variimorphobacter saccharofermentans]